VTWKDQSGNGNDATAPSTGAEPTIYTGGALVKENGKPAIKFLELGWPHLTASGFGTGNTRFVSYVAKMDAEPSVGGRYSMPWIFLQSPISTLGDYLQFYIPNITNSVLLNFPTNSLDVSSTSATNVQRLISVNKNAASSEMWFDGTSQGTGSGTQNMADGLSIGRFDNYGQGIMSFQEMIIYNSDKSSVRTSIESNIGDYFTQNIPLLDTYSGAAAAYSLRKLNSSYTGAAIEVYAGTNGTADIGFNVFGELDTVALAAHCGNQDGTVQTWYDQSGNGNHATQGNTGSQPKIYDGATTSVVTENGKPSLELNGDSLTISSVNLNTVFAVASRGTQETVNYLTWDNNTTGLFYGGTFGGVGGIGFYDGSVYSLTGQDSNTHLAYFRLNGLNYDIAKDGNSVTTFQSGNGVLSASSIGRALSTLQTHLIQEFIVYTSDQSDNRTGIEDNINTFYNIY